MDISQIAGNPVKDVKAPHSVPENNECVPISKGDGTWNSVKVTSGGEYAPAYTIPIRTGTGDQHLVTHTNEFNFVQSGFNQRIWFNYAPDDNRAGNSNIVDYVFMKGSNSGDIASASAPIRAKTYYNKDGLEVGLKLHKHTIGFTINDGDSLTIYYTLTVLSTRSTPYTDIFQLESNSSEVRAVIETDGYTIAAGRERILAYEMYYDEPDDAEILHIWSVSGYSNYLRYASWSQNWWEIREFYDYMETLN